jgi:hypothetical protein
MESDKKRRLNIALFAMLGSDNLVKRWWESPNRAFEDKTPNQMCEEDEQRVIDYVLDHLQR